MLLETKVKIKINQFNYQYYKDKGYSITKNGENIEVLIEDLPSTSGKKIHAKCEYCGKIFVQPFRRYQGTQGKHCCKHCVGEKIKEQTILKYGVPCTQLVPEVRSKTRSTMQSKYGVDYPLQKEEIRQKATQTMEEKYGAPFSLLVPTIREKIIKTLSLNGNGITTSTQQKLIAECLGGELNFSIGQYYVDVFLPEYNLCVEYDGGGHNLSVVMGHCSQKQFDEKEEQRNKYLVSKGYRIIHFVSNQDIIPPKEKLLEIFNTLLITMIKENKTIMYYNF